MPHKKAQLSDSDRDGILAEARSCVGTRFHFNHREREIALDCVGVVRHVMKARGFHCPVDVRYTARDCWGRRIYLDARVGMDEIALDDVKPGCVLMLWLTRDTHPQHLAFYAGSSLIHAHAAQRRVCEEPITPYWASRVLAAFELRWDADAGHSVEEVPQPDHGRRFSPRGGSRGLFGSWGSGQLRTIAQHCATMARRERP